MVSCTALVFCPGVYSTGRSGRCSTGSEETYLKALAKAKEHGFYLGMDFSWLDVTDA